MEKLKAENKDIIGYEGLYKITIDGKVIRLSRKKRTPGGKYIDLPEIELRSQPNKYCYPGVFLNKDGVQKHFTLHRLMAIHFIPNNSPLIKREVNHKNGNIMDYSISNLEWCTRSENIKDAKKRTAKIPTIKSITPTKTKLVYISPEDRNTLAEEAIKKGFKSFKAYAEFILAEKARKIKQKSLT